MLDNRVLYALTVLIWGSTWIGIVFQIGVVAPEVSIAYRFLLASFILFIFCKYKKLPLTFTLRQHGQSALLGIALFSVNYYFFYLAEHHINSALTAIGFSTFMILNTINARIWYKTPITLPVAFGALLGLAGIITLFWPEVNDIEFGQETLFGLTLCLLGTLTASMGNMVSLKNNKMKMPMVQTNVWGMAYGAIAMLIVALVNGNPLSFDWSFPYVASLLYLSIFGTVIAFGCYLTLLSTIGAHKASYATVLFPAVAVLISTIFEGFQWNTYTVIGFICIIAGNLVIVIKPKVSVLPIKATL